MTDKDIKDYCKNCDVEPPAMKFKCPECEHNPDKENIAKDINVPRKEQIIIDGIQFNEFGDFYVDYDLNGKFLSISSSAKEYKILKFLIEQLARKTQECEQLQEKYKARVKDLEERIINHHNTVEEYCSRLAKKEKECEELEDFRTLVRELFTFGDSDVDDEHFIKYLKEDCKSSQEALDGYCRLTDITGIDYTVHGGADIEEIVKRVDSLKHECEELKKKQKIIGKAIYKESIELCNENACYRKALEEIDKVINNIFDKCLGHKTDGWTPVHNVCEELIKILDIINKAKGEGNE